ncbi:MAG: hypothetical protein QFC55_03595 [Chloroflexota bacterium]|nr:hypothetical protein [Chloroflexota bacterium]
MTDGNPGPRSRDLFRALEVAALVVAGVLIVAWVTDLVPVLRDALSLAPLIIIGLIAVTILVLFRALWPRRSP